MILAAPIMRIIHGMFLNSIGSIQADSISGLVTWFMVTVIYVVVCLIVMHKIFALIYIIPNSVPRWFGGHASGHDKAGETESEAKGMATAAALGGRSAVTGALDKRRHERLVGATEKGHGGGSKGGGGSTPITASLGGNAHASDAVANSQNAINALNKNNKAKSSRIDSSVEGPRAVT